MAIKVGDIVNPNNNFGSITNFDDTTNVTRGAGVRPVGRIALAYAYEMRIGDNIIGLIRDITETHRRPVNPIYEIGTVGPVDLAPGQPEFTARGSATKVYTFNLLTTIYAQALSDKGLAGAINMPVIKELIDRGTFDKDAELISNAEQMLHVISGYPLPIDIHLVETRPTAFSPMAGPPLTNISGKSSTIVYQEAWITNYGKRVDATRDAIVIEDFEFTYRKPAVRTTF